MFAAVAAVFLSLGGSTTWTLSGGDPTGASVLVTSVVDGDTIHVGRGWRRATVRFIGVDTPETVHPDKPVQYYGPEATEFTRKSLEGRWVRLEFEPGDRIDAYARLLAYVVLEDGTLFNRELVRLGYARAYTRFRFRYGEDFRQAQRAAQEGCLGLWARSLCADRGAPARVGGQIIGNRHSKVYHLPGQETYGSVAERNRVYFDTEDEAVQAGYRRAKR